MTTTDTRQQVFAQLDEGWHDALTSALQLDRSTFVFAQGGLGTQTSDSSGLFRMSDSLPPQDSIMFTPGGMSRASAYGSLLFGLLPEVNRAALQNAMADRYAAWITYRDSLPEDADVDKAFRAWIKRHLDPPQAEAALEAWEAAGDCPLGRARAAFQDPSNQQVFVNSDGTTFKLRRYAATLDAAFNAVQRGKSASVHFDSAEAAKSSVGTHVHGQAGGSYSIFSASVEGAVDQLDRKAANASISVDVRIGSYATLDAGPGAWFDSGEYARAYHANGDHRVWDPAATAGTWDSYFGQPDGRLARRVRSLLVVSDCTTRITSRASYSQEEFEQVRARADLRVWPFFSAAAEASHTRAWSMNSDGSLTVEITIPKGEIEIWGVTVAAAPN